MAELPKSYILYFFLPRVSLLLLNLYYYYMLVQDDASKDQELDRHIRLAAMVHGKLKHPVFTLCAVSLDGGKLFGVSGLLLLS